MNPPRCSEDALFTLSQGGNLRPRWAHWLLRNPKAGAGLGSSPYIPVPDFLGFSLGRDSENQNPFGRDLVLSVSIGATRRGAGPQATPTHLSQRPSAQDFLRPAGAWEPEPTELLARLLLMDSANCPALSSPSGAVQCQIAAAVSRADSALRSGVPSLGQRVARGWWGGRESRQAEMDRRVPFFSSSIGKEGP